MSHYWIGSGLSGGPSLRRPGPGRWQVGLAAIALVGILNISGISAASPLKSPVAGQPRGVVPMVPTGRTAGLSATVGADTLSYGGGPNGVISGKSKVYLVFWGTQWGTSSTDSNGNLKFSNDTAGAAGRVQQLFKGLGTGGEQWSGVMTQYCDGVAAGATSCPAGAAHVKYPTGGGTLAAVWYDNSAAEPSAASQLQISSEALKASTHYGNTATINRNAQYVIFSAKAPTPITTRRTGSAPGTTT